MHVKCVKQVFTICYLKHIQRVTLFQVYQVEPLIGGIFGGFTYENTQCSSEDIHRFRSYFMRKKIQVMPVVQTRCESPVTLELSFVPSLTQQGVYEASQVVVFNEVIQLLLYENIIGKQRDPQLEVEFDFLDNNILWKKTSLRTTYLKGICFSSKSNSI